MSDPLFGSHFVTLEGKSLLLALFIVRITFNVIMRQWDSDKADVHSIHFSVGIAIIGEMVSPNFKPKFKAIEHIMKL
jgi:hypothetical protein